MSDEQFQELLDSQKAMTKQLSEQDKQLALIAQAVVGINEHLKDHNGWRERIEGLERVVEVHGKAVAEIPTLRERVSEVQTAIDAHAQGCGLKAVVDGLKSRIDTGDTTAGREAREAKADAQSVVAWRNRIEGALALLGFCVAGGGLGLGGLMFAIAKGWIK